MQLTRAFAYDVSEHFRVIMILLLLRS
ncbi:Protein of unknown function [Lactobacillus delbrueckii subsp. bulgaricus]|nr:Protein of unknown function [Lactobacillus delbrueckii subsp. bulgaricus]